MAAETGVVIGAFSALTSTGPVCLLRRGFFCGRRKKLLRSNFLLFPFKYRPKSKKGQHKSHPFFVFPTCSVQIRLAIFPSDKPKATAREQTITGTTIGGIAMGAKNASRNSPHAQPQMRQV